LDRNYDLWAAFSTYNNMYPDLSYLFHALIGTAPDNWLSMFKTFGFFLAMAFLVGAVVFYAELKRKAGAGMFEPATVKYWEGKPASITEILANALLGLILGGKGYFAFQNFETFRTDPAATILSGALHWPSAIIGAILLGGMTWWDARRRQLETPLERSIKIFPHDRITELTTWAAIGGILGAKLFDIFDNWESFLENPLGALLSGGGLAFLGGLILGFVAVVSYIYRNNIPFWPTADAVAPALAIGYGTGRIGCQLSGDGDWGIVNSAPKPDWLSWLPDSFWATTYPHNVLNTPRTDPVHSIPIEGCTWDYCMQLSEPVFPTPLYEIAMMSIVFGILWYLRKRIKVVGVIFCIYLMLTGIERYIIEKIRVNVVHEVMGMKLTQAEILSILLFIIGLVGMLLLFRQKDKE
jgi:phosphatidylglycerol---prolipoprotein diacylglyceryl transferase